MIAGLVLLAALPSIFGSATGGEKPSVETWERVRRPEIRRFLEQNEYGVRPCERPAGLSFRAERPDEICLGGCAVRKRITAVYDGPGGRGELHFSAWIPKSVRPVPVFIHSSPRPAETAADPQGPRPVYLLPVERIVRRGYAVVAYCNADVAADDPKVALTGGVFRVLGPSSADRKDDSWGVLSAWAWGMSRILDWVETEPSLDASRCAAVGLSRNGKAALVAGAFDSRFAMTVSCCSGCSGARLNAADRRGCETIAAITSVFPHWFCGRYRAFAGHDANLEFDQHWLLALVAPRLLYVSSATEDAWACPEAEYAGAQASSPAWELYGERGLVSASFPGPDGVRAEGRVGYHLRKGGHSIQPFDWDRYMDFADRNGWRCPVAFSNAFVDVSFSPDGRWQSLHDRGRNRELLTKPASLCTVMCNGSWLDPQRIERVSDGALALHYPNGICVRLDVDVRKDALDFTVGEVGGGTCQALRFDPFGVSCSAYEGRMANMVSDDAFCVALRAWDLRDEMLCSSAGVQATVPDARVGATVSLVAVPRPEIRSALQAVGRRSGAPMNASGGPCALLSEDIRGSYLFSDLLTPATDDVIDLARRAGISTVHIHDWWRSLGHYSFRQRAFPNGLDDFTNVVNRIHAAGLKTGIHTLTGCVSFKDPAFKTAATDDFIARASYDLAVDLTPGDSVVCVRGRLRPGHDRVMTYSSNGNVLRIGRELVQYRDYVSADGVSRFTDVVRGWNGTPVAEHKMGDRVDYLHQRYDAFYPRPGSRLADEVADAIAAVFRAGKLDQIYLDGSEGMGGRYDIDWMRRAVYGRLGGNALVEASCWGAHNWWFHSRLGAWDTPTWAMNAFVDFHVKDDSRLSLSDLLGAQLGWWRPRRADSAAPGHVLEDMEYFAGKAAAHDIPVSLQGVEVVDVPLDWSSLCQMTVLGWYERLRLARAFSDESLAKLAIPGHEYLLRMDTKGDWLLARSVRTSRRMEPGSSMWQASGVGAASRLVLRVEALYDGKRDDAGAVELMKGGRLPLAAEWQYPYLNAGKKRTAFAFRMKGENSGRVVRLRLKSPREFTEAVSDHYVLDDFAGWREIVVLARERDAGGTSFQPCEYSQMSYAVFRNPLKVEHVSAVSIEVVGGGSLEVGPLRAIECVEATLKGARIDVDGVVCAVPFDLSSGESAVLEGSAWTKYDRNGEPVARTDGPRLSGAGNSVAVSCCVSSRAQVSLSSVGAPALATKPGVRLTGPNYLLPALWNPAAGFDKMPRLMPYSDGPASVGVLVHGPVDRPQISFGDIRVTFPVKLERGDRLKCCDSRTWHVIDYRFQEKSRGVLATPLPDITAAVRPGFSAVTPSPEPVRVEFMTYRR